MTTTKQEQARAKAIKFWMKRGMSRDEAAALVARAASYSSLHTPAPTRKDS